MHYLRTNLEKIKLYLVICIVRVSSLSLSVLVLLVIFVKFVIGAEGQPKGRKGQIEQRGRIVGPITRRGTKSDI